ncbi:hypothetical protein HOD05_02815 [Candidatus Woesearchaeota archaeon]|jgi:hypothetical protein|nr:hypothetical protein [Candidatus Woesearchaeota archaeon]MBT4151304.1 hypothetical protein [Candidatus Woesearchaeota archaeon]MBT4247459.1 hypothetical protein [Candidatus Woesearchaeota archaeon]MBT4434126.1 hypothetical protein [Candidatus Woesearchaeota archaeon]MBT7331777.1 hypothetical protein [Candidatus Woesearchaeota archaeon]
MYTFTPPVEARKITYYHGSGSASLVGVLSNNFPGLMPIATLFREGGVSYGGEGNVAQVIENVDSFISTVTGGHLYVAIDYATKEGTRSWTPEIGKKNLNIIRQLLKLKENPLRKLGKVFFKVENRRIRLWKQLSDEERDLIQNPFPIIYRFNEDGEFHNNLYFQSGREVCVTKTIGVDDLNIHVPLSQIDRVERMARSKGHSPKILDFSELVMIDSLFEDHKRSLEKLLQNS